MRKTRQLVLTSLFIALGVILPQAFHAVPNAGSVFLPMHLPVLISGYVVGPLFGLICGAVTPLLSSLIFHMPPAPVLPGMLCELAVYGLMTGILSRMLKMENKAVRTYVILVAAMICGRISYGILNALIFRAGQYSLQAWLSAAFVTALPGIVIQLIAIPVLIMALRKAKLAD